MTGRVFYRMLWKLPTRRKDVNQGTFRGCACAYDRA